MAIFDRYLLKRYFHVFGITFTALFGLYVIFHVFTNSDEFFDDDGGHGTFGVLRGMAVFYMYRVSQFFDMVGGMVGVIAAMISFSLVLRNGELNPILSAGVRSFRILRPVLMGTVAVNIGLILNQELVIPRIAPQLQVEPGRDRQITHNVEPVYDFASQILITGQRLNLQSQVLEQAEFVLPVPKVVDELTTLLAESATFHKNFAKGRSGWLLKQASPAYDRLRLTEFGRQQVLPGPEPGQLFVVSDVNLDQIYKKDSSFGMLPTRELVKRIRNRSFSDLSIKRQSLYLHSRFTAPLLNVAVVILGMPLVLRRETTGIITNLATCGFAMGCVFAVGQAFQLLGAVNLIAADLAAWGPLILCGTAAAWVAPSMKT